jgi:hypothetical protein
VSIEELEPEICGGHPILTWGSQGGHLSS